MINKRIISCHNSSKKLEKPMIKLFLDSTRLNRPLGFFLLFWPCCWGLSLAKAPTHLYFVFFVGSVLMRSAGCIVNDFFDRDIDKKVHRTQNRPFATDQINFIQMIIFLSVLLAPSLWILFFFLPPVCWVMGIVATLMLTIYPLMKRITFFPQLFLGFTFNIGVLMGWLSAEKEFSFTPFILYGAGILWTLGYDTIYGFQDLKDDMKIGVKSTSIYAQHYPRLFLGIVYGLMMLFILYGLWREYKINDVSLCLYGSIFILLCKQIFLTDFTSQEDCLKSFNLNFWVGFLISSLWIYK